MGGRIKRAGLLLAFLLPFLAAPLLHAAQDVNEKYKRIQGDIKKKEEKLRHLKQKETSVLTELERIQKSLASLERELRVKQRNLKLTSSRIEQTKANIALTEESLGRHRAWLKRKLRGMHRQGNAEELEMLFGADDMASFLRRWRYLELLARKEKESFDSYKDLLKSLHRQREELDRLYARLKKEEEATLRAEGSLAAKRLEKQEVLASVRTEKSVHKKLLQELKEASRELLSMLRRSGEDDAYSGKGFRGLKGRLLWPVNGAVALQYGRQMDPQFKTPIFRNGVYIKTGPEAMARAVFEGKVVFADWFKGYGQLVILNHGQGYHTLYANLNEIFLKVGDIIEKRAEIGRVGESVLLNAPSLYFEVRYKGKPLDPLQWLGRK